MDTIQPKSIDEEEEPPILLPNGQEMIPLQLIEANTGYCPFPTQKEVDAYITNYNQLISKSVGVMHTHDRVSLDAMNEMLVGSGLVKNETWADAVRANFVIDFWPFIQSNQTYECVSIVMQNSPSNLFKLGAKQLTIGFLLLISSLI